MLSNTISLDGATGTEITFALISTKDNEYKRIDTATELSAPTLMTIRHSTSGSGKTAIDRHNVVFSDVEVDAAGDKFVGSVSITLNMPQRTVTPAVMKNLVAYAIDFLSGGSFSSSTGLESDANIVALLRGES